MVDHFEGIRPHGVHSAKRTEGQKQLNLDSVGTAIRELQLKGYCAADRGQSRLRSAPER